MLSLAAIIAITCVLVVIAPLFWTLKEPELADTFAIQGEEALKSMCNQVVEQYRLAEDAFKSGDLTAKEWKARSKFLRGRYLDFALRLGKQQ